MQSCVSLKKKKKKPPPSLLLLSPHKRNFDVLRFPPHPVAPSPLPFPCTLPCPSRSVAPCPPPLLHLLLREREGERGREREEGRGRRREAILCFLIRSSFLCVLRRVASCVMAVFLSIPSLLLPTPPSLPFLPSPCAYVACAKYHVTNGLGACWFAVGRSFGAPYGGAHSRGASNKQRAHTDRRRASILRNNILARALRVIARSLARAPWRELVVKQHAGARRMDALVRTRGHRVVSPFAAFCAYRSKRGIGARPPQSWQAAKNEIINVSINICVCVKVMCEENIMERNEANDNYILMCDIYYYSMEKKRKKKIC